VILTCALGLFKCVSGAAAEIISEFARNAAESRNEKIIAPALLLRAPKLLWVCMFIVFLYFRM
jgi:hypothetical protein